MKSRIALASLQAIGALSFLAWPVGMMGALLAEIPSWERVLLLVWPAVWTALWAASWVLLFRRRTVLAFVLSALPAAATIAGIAWYANWRAQVGAEKAHHAEKSGQLLATAQGSNPVAAALIAMERAPRDPKAWPAAQKAIEAADPELLSKPIPQNLWLVDLGDAGKLVSPLRIALARNETLFDFSKAQGHYLEAARLLVARGARLTADEQVERVDLAWLADILRRGITLPDPVAEQENPLVWRIVSCLGNSGMPSRPADDQPIRLMARQHPELLKKETRAYGTPLRAAFLMQFDLLAVSLVHEGAILSEKERAIPGLTRHVEPLLAQYGSTLSIYRANVDGRRETKRRSQ